ncbi:MULTISPECIES: RNA polymerase sigma factor [Amycolatopsis]|uniref:RNA polymerase sigma factor (Sigma-70 family) n=2 Tax=Amycolatopsis TaxID=1813 RepID=A0A2A9FER3_9PSEU|nr:MULTISPECIES: sigma-70 family RNA polymerase sigma factor [Amycolatopsis]PFG48915.1 RNA polymerase sigma factor (sigma-70 family) [Amycolatopsis sulphurea]RJQ85983.1 sigma-70 family RNA polymerase sigma factor [Amycolatopsis panacis]
MLHDDEVRRFGSRVARVLATTPGFRTDAEDACQAAWLEFLTCHSQIRDRDRLGAWLTTVARRHAIRAMIRRTRATYLPAPDEPSPETTLLDDERAAALWCAVAELPERARRLLLLIAHHPELKPAELAAEVGISPASVSKLRRRYLDQVRRKLEIQGFHHA